MKKVLLLLLFFFLSSQGYATFDTLAQQGGGVGDYFKLIKAEQLLKQNQPQGALETAQKVQSPVFNFWKMVIEAEAQLALGKNEAVQGLILQLPSKPQYKLSYGEGIYENLVKRALIIRVLSGGPASNFLSALNTWFPDDDDVKDILGPERSNIVLLPDWAVQKLHVLYERNRLKDIRAQISLSDIEAATLAREERCQSWFELGSALRADDVRKDEAIGILEKVVTGACGADLTPRALYRLGMIQPAQGTDRRSEFLTRLAKTYPSHRVADDAFYLLYKIAEEQNDDASKKKNFDALMSLSAGDMKGTLAFELGFEKYQKGDFAEAIKVLRQTVNTKAGTDESVPQVIYWFARSLEKSGEKIESKKFYTRLVKEFPFSFYAILASQRSGEVLKIPKLGNFKSLSVFAEEAGILNLVDALNGKGFHDAARAVLDLALQTGLLSEQLSQDFLTQKMLESQNYRKAIDLASQSFDDTPYGPVTGSSLPIFSALFPDAFDPEIKKIAKEVGLQHGVIQGLMREETLFQRTAVSSAGARGLMQLMPATAALVKKEHGLDSLSPDITDEITNITLGATYLKDMLDRFDGNLAYAIMAYNAGPGNVSKWLKRHPDKELDEFIELIPISETRNYVKRVIRSAAVYCAQHGEKFDSFINK